MRARLADGLAFSLVTSCRDAFGSRHYVFSPGSLFSVWGVGRKELGYSLKCMKQLLPWKLNSARVLLKYKYARKQSFLCLAR